VCLLFCYSKKFDERQSISTDADVEKLEQWILFHKFPLLDDIGRRNSKSYVENGIPLAFIFVNSTNDKALLNDALLLLAAQTRTKLNFVYIDWEKYGGQAVKLGLSGKKVPTVAIEDTKKKIRYAIDETKEINAQSITEFANQFLKGQLTPVFLSQPIPAENNGPVKVIVGHSFKDIVLDPSKDVFLELYAPWCGHCKSLAPIWEQLATLLTNEPDIVIAKIDATANDLDPKYEKVHMYPTLHLYKRNDKDHPVIYHNKDRSLDSLLQFLKENGSVSTNVSAAAEKKGHKDKHKHDHDHKHHHDDDDDSHHHNDDDKSKKHKGRDEL